MRFPLIALSTLVVATILLIVVGCDDDETPVSPETPPTIAFVLDSATNILPGATLESRIHAEGGTADLTKMRFTISGAVDSTDSVIYAPPVREVTLTLRVKTPSIVENASEIHIRARVTDTKGSSRDAALDLPLVDERDPEWYGFDLVNSYTCLPGDTAWVYCQATDNSILYRLILTCSGGWEHVDTIPLGPPYTRSISRSLPIVIPESVPRDTSIHLTGEIYDGCGNFSGISMWQGIEIRDAEAPNVSLRMAGDSIAELGDSVRFWVVADDNDALACIGYALSGPVTISDSTCGSLQPRDSLLVSAAIPYGLFAQSKLQVRLFATDRSGNRKWNPSYTYDYLNIPLQGRIEAATARKLQLTGYISDMVLDDDRAEVYLVNTNSNRVDLYSLSSGTVHGSVLVQSQPVKACLTADHTRLLVINAGSNSMSVISLTTPSPAVERTVRISDLLDVNCQEPEGITALANNKAYITYAYAGSGWCGMTQVDLTTWEVSLLDWGGWMGMASPSTLITSSGDYRFALVSSGNSSGGPVWLYDSQTDSLLIVNSGWYVGSIASNYDGTHFQINSGLFDRRISRIATIVMGDYGPSATAFARTGHEIFCAYTASGSKIGIFDDSLLAGLEGTSLDPESYGPTVRLICATADSRRLIIICGDWNSSSTLYDVAVKPRNMSARCVVPAR